MRQGYIGRPSQSEVTGNFKFSISAPMYGPDGAWIGVVYASFATDSFFLNHAFEPGDDPRATAALLARVDNDRIHQGEPLTTGFMIVAHASLVQGTGIEVSSPTLESMTLPDPRTDQLTLAEAQAVLSDDDYRDPVPGFGGRWLAGFAPVGNTGYVMVVQTRYSAIVDPDWTLFWRLVKWVALPLLVGGLAINLLLFFFRRRPA